MFSAEDVPEFDEPCPPIYRMRTYYMSLVLGDRTVSQWASHRFLRGPCQATKCAKLGRQLIAEWISNEAPLVPPCASVQEAGVYVIWGVGS